MSQCVLPLGWVFGRCLDQTLKGHLVEMEWVWQEVQLQKRNKKTQADTKSITIIPIYYIDTDEIPGFLLLLKNHIFTTHSEDTIFIFHMWGYWWGYWCGHGYQHNYPITIELLAQVRSRLIWNFIRKMALRCEDSRVIEFFSSLLEFWLFRTENISTIFFVSPL